MILDALRQSGGCAVMVEEEEIAHYQRIGSSADGIAYGLETSASLAAIHPLLDRGLINRAEKILVINTASSSKYWSESLPTFPELDLAADIELETLFQAPHPVHWNGERTGAQSRHRSTTARRD
jgi:threonine synthase